MPLAEPSISLSDDEEDLSPPQTEILIKAICRNDIATTEDILRSHGATAFLEHSRSSRDLREALQKAVERDHHLLVEFAFTWHPIRNEICSIGDCKEIL